MMVTRALHPHHLDDLLHGLASSHWALEKRSLLVLGRRSISGLKRGSKCIHFLVYGVVVVCCWLLGAYYDGSCGGSLVYDQSLGTPHSVTGFIGSVGMARIFYLT